MPDLSDLKQFDVPDPPKPRGSFGWGLVKTAIALGAALAYLQFAALDHYFAVLGDRREYGWTRQKARRAIEDWSFDAIRERVLAVEDPVVRGSFHAVLADSRDPAQIDAVLAYAERGLEGWNSEYDMAERLDEVAPSLASFGPDAAIPAYLRLYADPERPDFLRRRARDAIRREFAPLDVEPFVLRIEDPALRGGFPEALALTGDVSQIDAIAAHLRSASPSAEESDAFAAALRGFGQAGVPRLVATLFADCGQAAGPVAAALRDLDLAALAEAAKGLFDLYDRAQSGGTRTPTEASSWLATQGAWVVSSRLDTVMGVLESVASEAVDFCFIRGLSTFDENLATRCARILRRRLSPDALVDTLFRYIATKSSFNVSEVEVYEGLIIGLGATGADRAGLNLQRLLDESRGLPEAVTWIYKVIGLHVLRRVGTAASIPILERYQRDTGSYTETTTDNSGRETGRREIRYADEARDAIQAIRSRGSR